MHDDDTYESKAAAFEAADDIPINPDTERSIGAVIARRFSRREMLKGSLGVTAAATLFGASALSAGRASAETPNTAGAVFEELAGGVDEHHHIAAGYEAEILLRWGDPLFPGLRPFDPRNLTAEEQARRARVYNEKLFKTSAAEAAVTIVDGVEAGKERVLVGSDARVVDLMVRLLPGQYTRVVAWWDRRTFGDGR